MDHRPQAWGRPLDAVYGSYAHSYFGQSAPKTATQNPIVTGTSVIGIKFKDGAIIAADCGASYGSLARFSDVERIHVYNNSTILGFGGDISDMQYLMRYLNDLDISEAYDNNDSDHLNAENLKVNLKGLLYHRRNKFDPYWNNVLIAGFDNKGKPFLAKVDERGGAVESPVVATGMGDQLAKPRLRVFADAEEDAARLSKEDALAGIREGMKLDFYRNARAFERHTIAIVTKEGVELLKDQKLEKQSWAFAEKIRGYGTQTV